MYNREKYVIWSLSLIGFFAIFSTTISKNPVLPLYVQEMGGNDVIIGLISAISPLAGVLFSFPVGVLSDQYGRTKMLRISGFIFTLAPLMYILVSDPLLLIPVRFFHGLATAILGPVISAFIAERYEETKGERLGQYSSATLIGRTIAPFIGGILLSVSFASSSLFGYHLIYLTASFSGVVVLFLMFRFHEEKVEQKDPVIGLALLESLQFFFKDCRLRGAAIVDMGIYFSFGAFETFIPIYLNFLGIEPIMTGIIFSSQVLIIAATKPVFGKIADRMDQRYLIISGLLLIGISMVFIPFFTHIILLVLISLIFGLGMSLSTIGTSTYVADVTRKGKMGASMGALSSVMDIGHSSGPLIIGIILTWTSYTAGFGFCFLVIMIIGLYFFISTRKEPVF